MKLFSNYSHKAILNFILVIACAIVIAVNLIFNDTPEFFRLGYEIGQIMSNLSLSFIASYIFYLVVVVAQDRKNKSYVMGTVYGLTVQLVSRAYSLYDVIAAGAGESSANYDKRTISKDDFKQLSLKANPRAIAVGYLMSMPDGSNIQATNAEIILTEAFINVRKLSNDLFIYMPYLDAEQIQLVNKITNSVFFTVAPSILSKNVENTNFEAYNELLYNYLLAVRDLELYNEEHNKRYIKNISSPGFFDKLVLNINN